MDDDIDPVWMERLPQGFVTIHEEDVLADTTEAARLLKEAFTRTGAIRSTSDASSSSRSPQPKRKQPKRRRSSSAEGKNNKGLSKLILDKEKFKSEQDQLLAERDQIAARLPMLEAKVAEADELEARLQQSEKEVMALSQEASQLNVYFQEAKAKWSKVQNDVLIAAERESASIERLINLEIALNSKAEEATYSEEKRSQMEDKYKRIMEHYKVHIATILDLDLSLSAARSERDSLSSEVDQLKSELHHEADSLIIENTHSMYRMRRKTLEEAKEGLIDIDA
ncbi:uncharacterized protein [Nicotiana tomentosiformis]|uniref:uncharacterized protein n=1 Tax=Nicotiana tomentosiformis TaxID=4098 RepID=UPI00388C60D9